MSEQTNCPKCGAEPAALAHEKGRRPFRWACLSRECKRTTNDPEWQFDQSLLCRISQLEAEVQRLEKMSPPDVPREEHPPPWRFAWDDIPAVYDAEGNTVAVISTGKVQGPYTAETVLAVGRAIADIPRFLAVHKNDAAKSGGH